MQSRCLYTLEVQRIRFKIESNLVALKVAVLCRCGDPGNLYGIWQRELNVNCSNWEEVAVMSRIKP